jgi:TctA family transporter
MVVKISPLFQILLIGGVAGVAVNLMLTIMFRIMAPKMETRVIRTLSAILTVIFFVLVYLLSGINSIGAFMLWTGAAIGIVASDLQPWISLEPHTA